MTDESQEPSEGFHRTDHADPAEALAEAVTHVQDAVLAMVAAARAALDVVERLAQDPSPLIDAATTWKPGPTARFGPAGSDREADEKANDVARRARVEHVRVDPPEE